MKHQISVHPCIEIFLFHQVSAGDIVTISTIASLCLHAARVELELW